MKAKVLAGFSLFLVLGFTSLALGAKTPSNWRSWDAYPKGSNAPRYTADRIQDLVLAGEKMVFIYAGYETGKVVCGSIYLPYTLVPPSGSGSRVNLNIPKDTWMVAYCP